MASKGFVSWSVELLSRAQADALRKHVEAHSLVALKRDAGLREAAAIDFTCEAALQDGNGYTICEAVELLTNWRTAGERRLYTDALKLLRLRAAYLKFVEVAAWPEGHVDDN